MMTFFFDGVGVESMASIVVCFFWQGQVSRVCFAIRRDWFSFRHVDCLNVSHRLVVLRVLLLF